MASANRVMTEIKVSTDSELEEVRLLQRSLQTSLS